HCGLTNIFSGKDRYPVVDIEEVKANNCQLILLSSEPYPFKENNIKEMQESFPGMKIILANGEMFSWYGSRLLLVPDYFRKLYKSF
ncbi:MAG: cobalamin-binding protein, partial [Chitinophagaceae bacterium]|nr:cobalamin-binding protein [Chitinophagaceae bacterium]